MVSGDSFANESLKPSDCPELKMLMVDGRKLRAHKERRFVSDYVPCTPIPNRRGHARSLEWVEATLMGVLGSMLVCFSDSSQVLAAKDRKERIGIREMEGSRRKRL